MDDDVRMMRLTEDGEEGVFAEHDEVTSEDLTDQVL